MSRVSPVMPSATAVAAEIGELWSIRNRTELPTRSRPEADRLAAFEAAAVNNAASERLSVLEDLITILPVADRTDALAVASFAYSIALAQRDGHPAMKAFDEAALVRMLEALCGFLEKDAGTTAVAIGMGPYFEGKIEDWRTIAQRAMAHAARLRATPDTVPSPASTSALSVRGLVVAPSLHCPSVPL